MLYTYILNYYTIFIIFQDSITEQNKVILISVNTQCNINNQIKKLITNSFMGLNIQKEDLNANGGNLFINK